MVAIVLAGATPTACQAIDRPELEECGNGIVEPGAGEDCEPVGDALGCGAVGSGSGACRFLCTEQSCPPGYRCGLDAICRRPCLGYETEPTCSAFETLSSDVTSASIAQLSVVNVLGDTRPEIITVEYPDGEELDAVARVYRVDDETVAGDGAPVGAFPGLTRLDASGPYHLLAQRSALPPGPASATPDQRQAIVSMLTPEQRFSEVLIQGPMVVDPGPLRLASYSRPPDVPDPQTGAFLFGFQEQRVWQPEPTALVPAAPGHPDELLGPTFGQPIAEDFATAEGHLASETCPVMLYAYRGDRELFAYNLCDGVAEGWTSAPLVGPTLPSGAELGDGIAWGDANGDDLADLAVTTTLGRIHVAYAVGDGTFHSDPQALPTADGDGQFDAGLGFVTDPGVSLGVIAMGDFNDDDRPDFLTRSTWIRSCSPSGCGTCDVPGYRCDVGPQSAPGYIGTPASVVDRDGDGDVELAVLARDATSPLFPASAWGGVPPAPGDLVIIDNPGHPQWSARVIPLPGDPMLLGSGDIDGDARDEVILRQAHADGDELIVVYGADDSVERLSDFERIIDAHVEDGQRTLAVVSEDADGTNRRLTRLSANHERRLHSIVKLELGVVPRTFVAGRWNQADPNEIGLAVLGESLDGDVAVELSTRGSDTFFDASTRHSAMTSLQLDPMYAASTRGMAIDLDADGIDELVVFSNDGVVRTLHIQTEPSGLALSPPTLDAVPGEPYGGPTWPGDGQPSSLPQRRDLDGDGDLDIWLLTGEDPPRLAAFENRGDGTLDVAGRSLSTYPTPELSICDDDSGDCTVKIRAFAAFAGPTSRSTSLSPTAIDVLLVSRRALFLWTLDPFDPDTAQVLPLDELAVVRGGRLPLSPPGGQVFGAVADIDGDGVDDVVAGGRNGIRWLNGLAVIP